MIRPRVRIPSALALATVVALFASACGGDSSTEPEGLTVSDLVGSWKASSLVFSNRANPSQQFEIVAAGGELRVTVLDQGRSRTWLELGTFSDEWDSQLSISGNQLTSTPAESSRPTRHYTIEMSGDRITLTSTDASFDFTLTGAANVPANEVAILVRQ